MNEFKDLLLVLIGGFLSIAGYFIIDYNRDYKKAKRVKTALVDELHELRARLVLVIFSLESRYGTIDKNFFKWANPILAKYNEKNSNESLLRSIKPLLNLTGEQRESIVKISKQRGRSGEGLALKKHSLSLLDSNLEMLSKFDSILRGYLLDIKNRIGFMNEAIDDYRHYINITFQQNISTKNYEIANTNIMNSYKAYESQAKMVIGIIEKILNKT
ncbi:MAG: hypothetical protein A2729_01150 [Candidatus Buchananbacteria bacterium RIFCSPHIGHO2_01_FULL_39_14]|uniref:Uncharacterized protein n=2 Tax=Candidatus Buchananiibacteriota TaxID=1817903 RepID=A0A1G1YU84_9BACT|nr:MAG: hypothetical protein A2729_01150 [Candidatus Buchananbacteria bacterium RIFCSPHIGHO2_01_FULL_39_14]OGY49171.1 MAG: hypothetical protein A3D39_05690 [Candidatus Buchananbacteria bacterium RIFCSPHIGHO2_02_FULL_39_17]OGY55904.1 MAG: hypothetical protein A2912_02870 [Candidatus Buchananbacteria bacterium RIFCSPLOWO2_01_FULL_40_23b]